MGRRSKGRRQLSLLLVGRENAFSAENAARLIECGCFGIVARSSVLFGLEFCMDPGIVDVVIASGECRKEELTHFAIEGRRRGFSGLILQVADAPETRSGTGADETIQAGDFKLDNSNRRVWVRGAEVQFRPREFDLLRFLCAHADQHLSHQTLAREIWDDPSFPAQNVRALVCALRAKIETGPPWRYIFTRHHGYRFVPDGGQEPPEG